MTAQVSVMGLTGVVNWYSLALQANPSCVLQKGGSAFYYETREIPTLQSDRDVIVRVVATGLCGSDVCIPFSRKLRIEMELTEY